MSDLVLLLDQVKLLNHTWVVLEAILAHREQFLNRVLHTSLNLALVQNRSESFKNGIYSSRSCLRQHLSAFDHELGCHLDSILTCMFKEEGQNLEGK